MNRELTVIWTRGVWPARECPERPAAGGDQRGFTLIELLTVLAIITILVGLLVPSMNTVRRIANETAQRAQLVNIGAALTTFRNDFGDYPRSDWTPPPTNGNYCGAQKLAEALLGRDLMGFHPQSEMYDATDPIYDATEDNLRERRGRYLELTTANAFTLNQVLVNALLPTTFPLEGSTFVLCDRFGRTRVPIGDEVVMAGAPILYYRANTSSRIMSDGVPIDEWIYNATDSRVVMTLKEMADGKQHPLEDPSGTPPYAFFYEYIRDEQVPGNWPQRPDSFILISAGSDGIYGTPDDITNFEL